MAATEHRTPVLVDGGRALAALSSAALALPAYAVAPPEDTTLEYHYFRYEEGRLDAGKVAGNQRSRYDIDGHKLVSSTPIGSHYGLVADLTVESMSGASPWFITPDADNRPVQVMSSASIRDERADLLLALTRYDQTRSLTGSLGYSDEDDYRALNAGVEASFEPAGKQYSYAVGVGISSDTIEPTTGTHPVNIDRDDKLQFSLQASFTQILHAQSVRQAGLSLGHAEGYLSDPYKKVFITESSEILPDSRPDTRSSAALFLRWRRYFAGLAAALHLDYRLSQDSWDVTTHSLEGRWVHRFNPRWQLITGLRYYSQSQADFYAPFFAEAPASGEMSSDYRLSPYGALSLITQVSARLGAWDLALGLDSYASDGSYALGNVRVENPGLLDYQMIQARVSYRFE